MWVRIKKFRGVMWVRPVVGFPTKVSLNEIRENESQLVRAKSYAYIRQIQSSLDRVNCEDLKV